MKQADNDKLRELFHEIKIENPSMGFENRLMQQVQQEAVRKDRRQMIVSICWLSVGLLFILTLGVAIFYFMGWTLGINKIEFDFFAGLRLLNFSPILMAACSAVILLLFGEILISKLRKEKKHEDK